MTSFYLLITKFREYNKQYKLKERIILLIIGWVILSHISSGVLPLGTEMKNITKLLIKDSNLDYEGKMKKKVGPVYYDFTQLVRKHTTKDSYVMHPPQMWPWGQSGNPEFSQYFVFPAKLVRENRKQLFEKNNKITHVMIAWGEGGGDDYKGWPQFPVFAQKIYYLPQNRITEVRGLDNLQEWIKDADRVVNSFDGSQWDITYTSSQYDYWIKPTDIPLYSNSEYKAEINSNWPNSTSLVARVDFGQGHFAVFSSAANDKTDEWTTLIIDDLYPRATQFALLQEWPIDQLKVTGLGLDLGHPAKMPYLEKYGLMEVEQGGNSRIDDLNKQPVNSINLLALGNIYTLKDDLGKAKPLYQMAALLEPTNPWPHWGLAETAKNQNKLESAEQEYKVLIEVAPDLSWFFYALGEFYQQQGNLTQAEAAYQKSLVLYPGGFWTNRALGEVDEQNGKYDIAYRHYLAASNDGGRDFTLDGNIAWKKAQNIEKEQQKIIQSLEEKQKKNSQTPNDWQTSLALGQAYTILGDKDKAKEQYKTAYKLNPQLNPRGDSLDRLPPQIVDQLGQPTHGFRGLAVESDLQNGKKVAHLDNYHSYFQYPKDFFPTTNGTIEIYWKPPVNFDQEKGLLRNLLYQFQGLIVWLDNTKLKASVIDDKTSKREIISSPDLDFDINKWYSLSISYGDQGIYLYIDGKEVAGKQMTVKLHDANDIYLGRGPLWSSDKLGKIVSGYFESLKIYDYQRFK